MARLSTPSHPCETQYVSDQGFPLGKCRCDAYRKAPAGSSRAGQWECARCRHSRQRFEQQQAYVPKVTPPADPFTRIPVTSHKPF